MDTTTTSSSKLDKKKTQKPTIVIRVLKAPARVLSKIRDLYISSMYKCAGGMGGPASGYNAGLPRTYSTSSSRTNEDFAELVRIASTRSLGNRQNPDLFSRQQKTGPALVPRSLSVATGRIDEDKTYDFGDDFILKPEIFPRSKSHAVTRMYA